MEEVYSKLGNPLWYFDSITPALLIIFGMHLIRRLLPWLKSVRRSNKAKQLKRIQNERWCLATIQYQLNIVQSRFSIFILTVFLYLAWFGLLVALFISDNTFPFPTFSTPIFFLVCIPIYLTEIFWLNKEIYVNELLRRRRKLHKHN